MKLSIIVPVYNVEKYIRPCVESLFRQGLNEDDYEVILVNDGTQDNSFGIIEDIISKHKNIKIVEQTNQGLSVARNVGIKNAIGNYILFVDSDDLLVDNSLSQLLPHLYSSSADMMVAELVKMTDDEISKYNGRTKMEVRIEEKTATDIFLYDFNPRQCYVVRVIYNKKFLEKNKLHFIPGIFFEDVPFTTECYIKGGKCLKTSFPFYIYRQREGSIVSSINMKKLKDMNTAMARLWEMDRSLLLSVNQHQQLMNVIFSTFSISIWYITHNKDLLRKRVEYVNDFRRKMPDIMFKNGIKQLFVSIVFKIMPSTYIWLRGL